MNKLFLSLFALALITFSSCDPVELVLGEEYDLDEEPGSTGNTRDDLVVYYDDLSSSILKVNSQGRNNEVIVAGISSVIDLSLSYDKTKFAILDNSGDVMIYDVEGNFIQEIDETNSIIDIEWVYNQNTLVYLDANNTFNSWGANYTFPSFAPITGAYATAFSISVNGDLAIAYSGSNFFFNDNRIQVYFADGSLDDFSLFSRGFGFDPALELKFSNSSNNRLNCTIETLGDYYVLSLYILSDNSFSQSYNDDQADYYLEKIYGEGSIYMVSSGFNGTGINLTYVDNGNEILPVTSFSGKTTPIIFDWKI